MDAKVYQCSNQNQLKHQNVNNNNSPTESPRSPRSKSKVKKIVRFLDRDRSPSFIRRL